MRINLHGCFHGCVGVCIGILGLSLPVFKGIMKKGYRVPTPIQRKVVSLLPLIDCIVTVTRSNRIAKLTQISVGVCFVLFVCLSVLFTISRRFR